MISGIFIAEEAHGAGDKGSGDTTTAVCTAFFFFKVPKICVFHCYRFFFCSYSPEVLDYQDFQIVGCWIKGILLYII